MRLVAEPPSGVLVCLWVCPLLCADGFYCLLSFMGKEFCSASAASWDFLCGIFLFEAYRVRHHVQRHSPAGVACLVLVTPTGLQS